MKTLIVYDSVFGNTEKIARAMGEALGEAGTVSVVKVSEVSGAQLAGVDLFIAGSPTRGFRPTPVLVTYLKGLPAGSLTGIKVAAFDTRIPVAEVKNALLSVMVRLFGYAAKPLGDQLVKKGGLLAAQPEGFFVTASEGPLQDGELERAAQWARGVAKG